MIRRAPVVIGATVAGLAGLLAFHTRGAAPLASIAGGGAGGTGSGGASTSVRSGSGAHGGSGTSGTPATSTPATTTPTTTQAPSTVTETGSLVQYSYGELDVALTVSDGRITDVTVPTLDVAEPTSEQIAQEAIPVLRREVLSAQSADIEAVSGATYTSRAYAQSVQSALDKAKQG